MNIENQLLFLTERLERVSDWLRPRMHIVVAMWATVVVLMMWLLPKML